MYRAVNYSNSSPASEWNVMLNDSFARPLSTQPLKPRVEDFADLDVRLLLPLPASLVLIPFNAVPVHVV